MTDSSYTDPRTPVAQTRGPRRPYRPPVGLPIRGERRGWRGLLVSVAIHGAILLALLLPALLTGVISADMLTAGDAGARGGGGGGRRGAGLSAEPERLQFIRMPPAAVPTAVPDVPVPPPPKPEVTPPAPQPTVPPPPAAEPQPSTTGGSGTGADATNGTGQGTGGGSGTGAGTGSGSTAGPGTGGDGADHDPPVVTNLAILPIPVPRGVRPYRMVAYFDVDEKGNAKLLTFNPSNDGGYNRRIREMLAEIRFRPAQRRDGTAIRDTAMIVAEAP
ncbi:MAG: hypothetical protein MUF53_05150 [Gemmatimonadaceae bacterium]|nr:hypothetical protein [Gemmatimonadaceae bacterium]